ncbi:MAG: PD-(D/E)XK nuclease family protein [Burkholderiales bacterium]|nr:PD-(D/E)XK nuclease family protein [Burkholderiales bacterium]
MTTTISALEQIDETLYLCPSDRAARGWRLRLSRGGGSSAIASCRAVESWLVDVWQRGMLFGYLPAAPALFPLQAQRALWLALIDDQSSMLLAERDAAAAQADEAWRLAVRHGYAFPRQTRSALGADNVAWFATLARAARNWLRTRGLATRAELPALLAAHAHALHPLLPSRIRLTPTFASDPALDALWQALRGQGVDVAALDYRTRGGASPLPVVYRAGDVDHELDCALDWAIQQLSQSGRGDSEDRVVTLIVPDFAQTRERWQRRLRERLNPGWWQDPATDRDQYDLSLGRSLADQPTIRALLTLLHATTQAVDVELIAQALTHPRWGGSPGEAGVVHAQLRDRMDRGIAATTLADWCIPPTARVLIEQLATDGGLRRTRRAYSDVVAQFTLEFSRRAMIARSELFQLEEAWRQLLHDWCGFDDWFPPLSWPNAMSELSRLARDTVFQPESGVGRLQVIGLLESAGVPLERARLLGMNDRVLPERFAPNALLPRAWQGAAGVGLGSRAEVAARANRIVMNWRALIADLSVSYAAQDDDTPLGLSPLFAACPVRDAPARAWRAESSSRCAALQTISDERLPPAASDAGDNADHTLSPSRLREQAQCPRRAAALRLGLQPWPAVSDGIPPALRGSLVHAMLAAYGSARRDAPLDAGLLTDVSLNALDELIANERTLRPAIADVIWQTERTRIAELLEKVLAVDAARPAFAVVAVEEAVRATVAGQRFRGKFDRVDQVGDMRIILDYKTGNVSRSDWIPEHNDGRLADPQLPLYALMDRERLTSAHRGDAPPPVRAVAWFVVNDDRVSCVGAGDDHALNGGRQAPQLQSWDSAVALWEPAVASLVAEWHAGIADIAPLKGRATCQRCEFGAFCRERWSLSGTEEGADSSLAESLSERSNSARDD